VCGSGESPAFKQVWDYGQSPPFLSSTFELFWAGFFKKRLQILASKLTKTESGQLELWTNTLPSGGWLFFRVSPAKTAKTEPKLTLSKSSNVYNRATVWRGATFWGPKASGTAKRPFFDLFFGVSRCFSVFWPVFGSILESVRVGGFFLRESARCQD